MKSTHFGLFLWLALFFSAAAGAIEKTSSLEVNVLYPLFGISEFRYVTPLLDKMRDDRRAELILGFYTDYASHIVRDETYGKVFILAPKVGYRQYFAKNWHAEISANMGWRHESQRPPDNITIDGFSVRLWTLVGYQCDISDRFYVNVRGGFGTHIYRSDTYASLEKKIVPGLDVNLGVRF